MNSLAVTKPKLVLHMLTAYPPHNVNRDEDGRPKTALLGGHTRGRVSSQAKKRALRFSPHTPDGQRAIRTRLLGIEALLRMLEGGATLEEAVLVSQAVNKATGGKAKGSTKGGEDSDDSDEDLAESQSKSGRKKKANKKNSTSLIVDLKKELGENAAVLDQRPLRPHLETNTDILRSFQKVVGPTEALVVSPAEMEALDKALQTMIDDLGRQDGKGAIAKFIEQLEQHGLLGQGQRTLDLALFGRMVASDPQHNIEAASSVGHAITTHAFSPEADYFSAGEELESSLRGTGAAITSYAFFGSGVYYQHAVLDYAHLRQNLGTHGALAEQGVRMFLRGLVHAQPTGKRNSFASDTSALYVLARRTTAPTVNLGFAFLDPVTAVEHGKRRGDLACASIERLAEFDAALADAYAWDGARCAFNAYPPARKANTPPPGEVWTFAELEAFALAGLEGGA